MKHRKVSSSKLTGSTRSTIRDGEGETTTASHRDQGLRQWRRQSRITSHHFTTHDSVADVDVLPVYMAGPRRESSMTERWRGEDSRRPRDSRPSRGRHNNHNRSNRSPPGRRAETAAVAAGPNSGAGPGSGSAVGLGRGRFHRDDYHQRPVRKRDFSPDHRRPPARRSSFSPARSPRPPPNRGGYPGGSAYSSRESSPARFPKRRRTRSPSPSDWSDRGYDDHRPYSRSRSRDRYDSRDSRPVSRRGASSRRGSPPRTRPQSRGGPPDTDTYIPDRRRHQSPRHRARRSPSSRPRSTTPPYRRRSITPPRYLSRPDSPASRYDSPPSDRRNRHRDTSPDDYLRRRSVTRTPSPLPPTDLEPMDGPVPVRGYQGNPNFIGRGRGSRGYGNRGGAFRGTSVASTPNSSHHGSPNSHASYHGGRGGWDGPQQQNYHSQKNGPPYRQNNFNSSNPNLDDYPRNQQQSHHPYPNQPQRPYRGRGQQRGAFGQHGPDRRFSGPPDQGQAPFSAPRGRGGHFNNNQWTASGKRGGGPSQPLTGANSIRPPTGPAQKDFRDFPPNEEDDSFQPPRGPQAEERSKQDDDSSQHGNDTSQQGKFKFAFKSKAPPPSPARPASDLDLTAKAKQPPTHPANNRPPPTQPRGNRFHDKRPYHQNNYHDRRRDDYDQPQRQPPKGPSQPHADRTRPPPSEPRARSRSPPPKKLKQDLAPPKPTLTPEMAASESIYFRKPGNESVVGAGTYGKVFKAIHIFTKDRVALKKIRMEGERDGFPITAVREIKLLQNLRHKHIVALHEVMVEKNECFMVFEYMSHDLTGLINHPTFKLTPAHKKDLGRQMFEGLEFLHRRGVMHRDIKAANLLISSTGQLKYADFGLARFYTKSRKLDYTNRVITIWYRPPELLLGETQYGPAVDIWSAACVFMEMFTRKAIFPGEGGELSQLEKIYNVLGTPTRTEWAGIADLPWYELMQPALSPSSSDRKRRTFESLFSEVLSPAALDVVTQIFRYDPAMRPDAAEILRHAYFTSEDPPPQQAWELEAVGGDWHEYESKAHRRENERKEKERRREEYIREKERKNAAAAGKKDEKRADMAIEGKGVDEVPAAPLPVGEEVEGGDTGEGRMDVSDGEGDEGSARMSMS